MPPHTKEQWQTIVCGIGCAFFLVALVLLGIFFPFPPLKISPGFFVFLLALVLIGIGMIAIASSPCWERLLKLRRLIRRP